MLTFDNCNCRYEKLSHETIPFDCERVWDIFSTGLTKGVFQLEKGLGRGWSKKLRPESIEEVAALISLIRPGCLNSGMTEKYYKVKWNQEESSYLHEGLREILEPTHSCLVYQEQCMEIARKLAGFNLSEADSMRKAIGKKLPELMAQIESKFIDGCVANGHDKEIAEKIFGWIVEFAEYGFNKCLSKDSIVLRENGEYDILDNIKKGDKIQAYHVGHGELYFDEVVDVIDQGEQECFEFEMNDGEKIICTMNHKFMCADNKMHTMHDIVKYSLEITGV